MQELLGHCLAQLQDNNRRVESLEAHLQEYGYKGEFVPPTEPAEPPADEASSSEFAASFFMDISSAISSSAGITMGESQDEIVSGQHANQLLRHLA